MYRVTYQLYKMFYGGYVRKITVTAANDVDARVKLLCEVEGCYRILNVEPIK